MIPLNNPKLMTLEQAVERRAQMRQNGQKLVLTNGVFDLLHTGHLYFLQAAAAQGGALWIALNADASTRALKGPTRPVQTELERGYALAALGFVSGILIFETPRLDNEIRSLSPDIYVKAGDYTLESLNPIERTALQEVGAEVRFLPFLEGFSTTALIAKIAAAATTF
jgi:rfaE bifunctional protein nucleotidyltransferase chain/domain